MHAYFCAVYLKYMEVAFRQKNEEELAKPVTFGILLEYTEEVLIPRFSDVVDDKIKESEERMDKKFAKYNYELKDYIDRKLTDHTTELFRRLDARYDNDKKFKSKVLEILRRNNFASSEELAFLEGLVAGI